MESVGFYYTGEGITDLLGKRMMKARRIVRNLDRKYSYMKISAYFCSLLEFMSGSRGLRIDMTGKTISALEEVAHELVSGLGKPYSVLESEEIKGSKAHEHFAKKYYSKQENTASP